MRMTLILLTLAMPIGAAELGPVDFDTEIIPVLTKAGCNAGACHGAAAGRGGFHLSLYGSDPASDHQEIALVREGRRLNLASPKDSLLLLKPTGWLDHGGGERLVEDGAGARLVLRWINEGGARRQSRRLVEFSVTPQSSRDLQIGDVVALGAMARFDDGAIEDVTEWTVFTSSDPSSVEVDESHATVQRRGRHLLIARYLDRVVPIELLAPLSPNPVHLSDAPRQTFIDSEILDRLEDLRIPVSPISDDGAFLRRVTLDLTGRLPRPQEVSSFQNLNGLDKRAVLVEQLLASDEFTEYWTFQFAKLLRIRSQAQEARGALAFHEWLTEQIASGTPYDQMVRVLLTAEGDTFEYGPANFYTGVGDAREQAEFVSELLLGIRLRCANCHNHPLDRWTQDDYHGLAAIFAGVQPGRVVRGGGSGKVIHPRTGEAAVPRIPGERFLHEAGDLRPQLAEWVTSSDNAFFARAAVNRVWKHLMGRGLVDPTDDLRTTNPATHPALLDKLAEDFVDHRYDLRHTMGLICTSEAYSRCTQSVQGNAEDDRYYSHALVRPLEPEVLADAIADVTGVFDQYGDQPAGTRAVALFDSRIPAEPLDILGRCSRDESCEEPVAAAGGLALKLHLVNGELINPKLSAPSGRLTQQLADNIPANDLVDDYYARCFGRDPSRAERAFWSERFRRVEDHHEFQALAEDFVWSLLTSREFNTNH